MGKDVYDLYIQVLYELFICSELISNELKFCLMKIQSSQQRADSTAPLFQLKTKAFLTAFGSSCKFLTSGIFATGHETIINGNKPTKRSKWITKLLEHAGFIGA